MRNTDKIKAEFYRIKKMGFVQNTRPNNRDGGIGNTFEDLLGVKENNKKEADFEGIEIKSQRFLNNSYVTLFSKSPDYPKKANSYLREKYGEIRQEEHSDKKILYSSVFGHREGEVYSKYKMKLNVDRSSKSVKLLIKNLHGELLDTTYWNFDTLINASQKLSNLFLVFADTEITNGKKYCRFTKGELYYNFDFQRFLNEIEKGNIMFDIRIGVYNSGKNYGKIHDHGSGFRIKAENFKNLYTYFETL
mgnify:CR=1 FL=1|jgi:hypothetical protein